MGIIKSFLEKYRDYKRYRIVAYNNRMYTGFRNVNDHLYTYIGAKLWISEFADRTRYVYDLFDVKKDKLVNDYSQMFTDFEAVKQTILKANSLHEDSLRKLIFNFKEKWTRIAGDQAASIYFADLMIIFRARMDEFESNNL